MKPSVSTARLFVIASMVIFGTIGVVRTYIPSIPSGLLAALRGLVGALFLLALLYLRGGRLDRRAIGANLWPLVISGALMGFNWILLFEAYRYTTVAVATLCYYMAPVFVLLASPFLLRERLSVKKLMCVLVSLVGMVAVSGVLGTDFGGVHELRGILLALGAAVLYACVVLINQRLRGVGAYDKTIVQLAAAGVAVGVYSLLFERVDVSAFTLPSLLLVGVICIVHTGLAYALYFGAMDKLTAATVALLSYIDPVVSVVLSALVLREGLDAAGWIGAVLILGAAVLGELPDKTKKGGSAP